MLYTGKGDNGKTSAFGNKEKFSKSSPITEALGSVDEADSFIGICKAKIKGLDFKINDLVISEIIDNVQNDLFIVQAQIAGADKKISEGKIKWIEEIIGNIESELPPIKSFLIPGANEISAHFDFARTLARRAERRVVGITDEYSSLITGQTAKIDPYTLAYLNRLSSLLYAFARFSATKFGEIEKPPTY